VDPLIFNTNDNTTYSLLSLKFFFSRALNNNEAEDFPISYAGSVTVVREGFKIIAEQKTSANSLLKTLLRIRSKL